VFEAYDRSENLFDEIDPNNIRAILQIKDSIIEELSDQVRHVRCERLRRQVM
jgi:hypothetical protein